MNSIFAVFTFSITLSGFLPHLAQADTFHQGHYRSDGAYVSPAKNDSPLNRTAETHWNDVAYDAWTAERIGSFAAPTRMQWN